ncbi:hypothetical protein HUT19_24805 [Streptomyces sp. NA02950]|uniref:hypothetical protein n=1 Tax=Streptomyces sp. NA02950 TaxID=2742137 RepID=UPI001591BC2E|nr:hypothetical protein [Streptomyces sp. NA02950]QKV94573.1 hypothetical protein HUT19_24805 [Streptomyces sp. NA02950]
MKRHSAHPSAAPAALFVLALLLGTLAVPFTGRAAAADGPTVAVSPREAGTGGSTTVTGRGWRPRALLTLLICGQNMIGGTDSCANSDGRAVTTGADGTFRRKLPVVDPPKPCPCVVHVATVTGDAAAADVAFRVAGHPVKPLPTERTGGERLSVLSARLDGSSGPLTWFGAPPRRTLVVTVANLGSTPARDPVFRVGASHGVFAPSWEERQWRGTLEPGKKAQVKLAVELSAGAHGDYVVSLKYGRTLLVEQPWTVGRPWGVTFFWILLCVVIPAAVFRIGMAVVDKVRPRPAVSAAPARTAPTRRRARDATPLPWFTPDTLPGPQTQHPSAPSENNRPTPKGST